MISLRRNMVSPYTGSRTMDRILIPDMLKVKAGFHHDLNAKANEEPTGPTFPCTTKCMNHNRTKHDPDIRRKNTN